LNATMILQRSTDNRNFTDITSITATAARCQQPFDYIDIAAASGTNYYRLKTINDDGKITYSIVIVIVNKATGFDMVSLLPNIVRSNALLNITSAQKTTLQMVITDAMGRPMQKAAYSLIAGSNQFEITVANLPAGMYRITGITAEGQTKTIAFVKQ
ncbi:MAG: T9SS type A sorting domain-containing protein, partial [Ferruginibacter sp.]